MNWYKCPHCSTCLPNQLKFHAHRDVHNLSIDDDLDVKHLFYLSPNGKGLPLESLNLPTSSIHCFIPKIELTPIEINAKEYILRIKPCKVILVKLRFATEKTIKKEDVEVKSEGSTGKSLLWFYVEASIGKSLRNAEETIKTEVVIDEVKNEEDSVSARKSMTNGYIKIPIKLPEANAKDVQSSFTVHPIIQNPEEPVIKPGNSVSESVVNEFNLRTRRNRIDYAALDDNFPDWDSDDEKERVRSRTKKPSNSSRNKSRKNDDSDVDFEDPDPGADDGIVSANSESESAEAEDFFQQSLPAAVKAKPKLPSPLRRSRTFKLLKASTPKNNKKSDDTKESGSDSEEKIENVANLEKPNFICNLCDPASPPTYLSYRLFLTHMQSIHHKYDPDSSYPCPKCDFKAKDKVAIKSILLHHTIHHDLNLNDEDLKCYLCQPHMEFSHLEDVRKETQYNFHLKTFHQYPKNEKHDEPYYICAYCGKSKLFYDVNLLTKHLLADHKVPNNWTVKFKSKNLVGRKFPCKICGKKLDTESKLFNHLKTWCKVKGTAHLPFRCTVCSKGYNSRKSLRYHINIHRPDNPYICKICEYPFTQRRALERHVQLQHMDTTVRFKCPYCEKISTRKEQVRLHIRKNHLHETEKPIETISQSTSGKIVVDRVVINDTTIKQEPLDEDSVPSADTNPTEPRLPDIPKGEPTLMEKNMMAGPSQILNTTKAWDENRDLFKCSYCIRRYSRYIYLTRHLKTQHPDKVSTPQLIFRCEYCGLKCDSEEMLEKHEKIHGKQSKCSICSIVFPNRSELRKHNQKLHPDKLRRFKCEHCDKAYAKSWSLKEHLEICPKLHTDPNPSYKCNVCGRVMVNLRYYQSHMKLHSGKRKFFYCKTCNDRFSNAASLQKHVTRVHMNVMFGH